MPHAYLTIDDSPSPETGQLTVWLAERNIPALLFCRGDRLAENRAAIVEAIERGFVIGNHAFSHTRFSELTFEEGVEEIEQTERLINEAYQGAGCVRPGEYFRFPHMDRGAGGWVVDYEAAGNHKDILLQLFSEGLNIDLTPPDQKLVEKKHRLQAWLKDNGFTPPPFAGVTFPWYQDTEIVHAIDAMFTYSTSDWMVTPRHAGKWRYKTLPDLMDKANRDPFLWDKSSAHIILMHDQPGMFEITKPLVEYLQDKGIVFMPFTSNRNP